MKVLNLEELGADALLELPSLYILGVNGPLDEAGIGRVDRFVWRFAVVDEPSPVVLAFSAMPLLMRFTRAVNGAQAFTVPTEALRVRLRAAHAGLPVRISLDAVAEDFLTFAGGRRLAERVIPELEF